MTARQSGARAAYLKQQLTTRDLAVLGSIFDLRLLRGDQVRRLHVAEGSPLTQARRARSLLRRLHDHSLIRRFPRRVGGDGSGSNTYTYGLTGLGLAVLEVDGRYGARRRTEWEIRPAFADHVLAVAELHTRIVEATRSGNSELLRFESEPACYRRFSSHVGGAVTLKPDAYVEVGVGDIERHAFIEMDMGTERTPTLTRKMQTFIDYWRTGIEQRANGIFPLSLWLVPDEQRSNKLKEVIHKMTHETHNLFHIALHGDGATLLTAPAGEGV